MEECSGGCRDELHSQGNIKQDEGVATQAYATPKKPEADVSRGFKLNHDTVMALRSLPAGL